MLRRVIGGLVAALLLIVPAVPALAAAPRTVLAVEGTGTGIEVEEELLPGPAPMAPDAEDNPAAPTEYEANFLWGAAAGLLVLVVVGVLFLGLLYYLLVWRPRQRSETR